MNHASSLLFKLPTPSGFTLTRCQATVASVTLGFTFVFSLSSFITILIVAIKANKYANGDLTVDDVSLIPSVSNFLTSITNSAHTTDFLTRASAITAALSMIDWSAQFPQACVDYKGCDSRDIESCSDMLNQKDCERLTSDGGIFSPHDGCNWYQGAWNGSCYGEAVVCSTTRLEMDSECCDISIQTSPQTNMDRHNAFSRASEQLQGMIQHTKGLPKSPSSRFDVIGYLADELSQDWGEIGSRVVETLENIADYDWEAIFTTTNGSLYANRNAARVVASLKFYRNLVVKVTEPLKGV